MNVMQQLLTDHIDIWTAAETERKSGRGRASVNAGSVYGIKKLRELILELAARGKLVPQDSNDEPAIELLKHIKGVKAKLVADGHKKKKLSSQTTAVDKSCTLPKGWEWSTFGDIYTLEYGDNLPSEKRSNTGEFPVYGSNGVVGSHNVSFVNAPCIVVGRKGSAGALNLSLSNGCCVTDVAYYCVPPKCLDLLFSFKLFHTLSLDRLGKGIKPGLNRNEAYELSIAIPPLAEQHRIVAKVVELMALCDQLEAQHGNAAEAHEKLVSHLLSTLTLSQSAEDFSANWQRIAAHFDTLFTTESSIDALKQTLLQLAVMGKLVPQDARDEPASELLARILTERDRQIEQEGSRTIARDEVLDSEMYIAIPNGWQYCRLGNLARFIDYRGKTPNKINSGVPLITAKNVRYGYISREPKEFISATDYKLWMTRGFPRPGDMLFTTEAPLGNIALIDIDEDFALAQRVICFQLHEQAIGSYLRVAIMSYQMQQQFINAATGMTATGIKASKLKEIPVPIPPIEEQQRIVAKVDELMVLCDQLKCRITDASQLQQKIADVLAEQAVA